MSDRVSGWMLIGLIIVATTCTARAALPPAFDPQRHVRVDEVRPGMTGYGLTVFQGVQIEPFAVEVVSVQHGFDPGRAVVWVRCPDERMQRSGPVQGMSGSPIYLWSDGEEHKLGTGGRLLGAFAFGHRLGKDCYVGIQPIEHMLAAAQRSKAPQGALVGAAHGLGAPYSDLAASFALSRQLGLGDEQTWRLRAIAELVGYSPREISPAPAPDASATVPLALPVNVLNADHAAMLAPFFAPMGLAAHAAPGSAAGPAPQWIDPDSVSLRPGSVFAVPLVFGPLDMAAVGTTTEVLPDGTVLAFGHSFFGIGDTAVPMASGYVHFIQPSISVSFKLAGSLQVMGALVRDEQTAIVGKPGAAFPTAPVKVTVRWPDASQTQTFDYRIVHLPRLIPSLMGTVVTGSLMAHTELPDLNTLTISGTMRFANGWELPIREIHTGANTGRLVLSVAAPLGPLLRNEFAETSLQSAELTLDVEQGLRAAQVVGATLRQAAVRPGEKVIALVKLNRHRLGPELRTVEIEVPTDLPDGQYMLTIGGARTHYQNQLAARPHLARSASAEELFQAIAQVQNLRDDALYASLRLRPTNNLAIGRSELPHLPGSRAILLASEGSTRTSSYLESIDVVTATPYVVLGSVSLPVNVSATESRSAK